jgi:hypothetical protein
MQSIGQICAFSSLSIPERVSTEREQKRFLWRKFLTVVAIVGVFYVLGV